METRAIFGQAKILNHPEKIEAWMTGAPESLITVEIDLTNRCNNQCPGCAGGRSAGQAELTKAEILTYLDELKMVHAKAVIFTGGGEPLLHDDALDILQYAAARGFDIGLITNGLALATGPKSEWIKDLVHLCTWIRVSLDADGPEMYRQTHGVNRYYAVVGVVEKLVEAKRRDNATCTLGLGFLTGADTISGMEGFLQNARTLGVDYAQFRPFHGDKTDIRILFEDLKERYPFATASIQKYAHFGDANPRPYTECHGRHFTTVIGADAEMYVCCHLRGKSGYSLGNLRKRPFAEVWEKRHNVAIKFSDCPLFCRNDENNRLLFELKKPKTHVNFL